MAENNLEIIDKLSLQRDIFGDDLFVKKIVEIKYTNEKPPENTTLINENTTEIYKGATIDISTNFPGVIELADFRNQICDCQLCPLGATRNKFVYGVGNPNAKVMLVGEGPGAEEDKEGEPFVGRAGKLLTDILAAIHFTREEIYIANIVKCRPPENRKPLPLEIEKCIPYLYKQIEIINPQLILCLGATASEALLKLQGTLKSMRLKEYKVGNAIAMVTYHPAALLRNPAFKKDCWEDVQIFRKLYDSLQK